MPILRPADPEPESRHAYHLYTLRVAAERCGIDRDGFMQALHERGIGTGVHYLSLAEHPYYQQRLGWRPEDWPVAMRIGRETVSLPLSARLGDGDVERIVAAVHEVLGASTGRG